MARNVKVLIVEENGSELPRSEEMSFTPENMPLSSSLFTETDIKAALEGLVGRVRQVITQGSTASTSTFTKIGQRFIWIQSRNAAYKNGCIIFDTSVVNYDIQVRVVNATTSTVLATSSVITTSSRHVLSFAVPTSDCALEVQVSRVGGVELGANPQIVDAVYEFTTIGV